MKTNRFEIENEPVKLDVKNIMIDEKTTYWNEIVNVVLFVRGFEAALGAGLGRVLEGCLDEPGRLRSGAGISKKPEKPCLVLGG